jgi:tetratricopeptide (TPR) repeat protein
MTLVPRNRSQLFRACLTLVLAIVIGMSPSSAQQTASDEHLADLFSQAQAAQQQNDFRTAANCYEQIVKLRPDVAEAWANLGLMHQFLNEFPQADHDFQVALGSNPRLFVPNLFLGLNRVRTQQPAPALRYLKAAEALNPKDEQVVTGLAHAFELSHDDFTASKWFLRAIEINPNNPDAWYGLGTAYLRLQDSAVVQLAGLDQNNPYARALVADAFVQQGRSKDAIDIHTKLLASPVQPPCLMAGLAFAYAGQDSGQALKTFQEALQKEPECLSSRLGLAHLAVAQGDFAEAVKQANLAWNADQHFVRANFQLIWRGIDASRLNLATEWLAANAGAQGEVAQFLERSLSSETDLAPNPDKSGKQSPNPIPNPNDDLKSPAALWAAGRYTACEARLQRADAAKSSEAGLLLAQCSYYSGDYQASLAASETSLHRNPHSAPFLYWKAKSSQNLASDAFGHMSALAPGSPKVHLLMAELHRAREEFGAAESEYNQVISLRSDDLAAHLGLAQVYYQESQDDKAVSQLQLVLQADPTGPQANFVMGQVLVRRHQYADALPYLKTALNGAPLSLPQVHSLLAKCLAAKGDYSGALDELKPALSSDTMGIFHYQLYQIYQKLGDDKAAAVALAKSQSIRRAESATKEIGKTTGNPAPQP